jgi:REP element-mobilizing transposase RayT
MPRKPRIVVEGGLYHVHNRFARGAAIFDEGDEGERFLELLHTVRDRDGLTVLAWCLMANH